MEGVRHGDRTVVFLMVRASRQTHEALLEAYPSVLHCEGHRFGAGRSLRQEYRLAVSEAFAVQRLWIGVPGTVIARLAVAHPRLGILAATATVCLSLASISPHRISRAEKSRCTASPRITQVLAWASRVALTGTALEPCGMPHLPVATQEASKTKPPSSVRGVPTDPMAALRIDSHKQKYVTSTRLRSQS